MTKRAKCDFCKKTFRHEHTLLTHSCVYKQRALEKDEKHVQIGYMAYKKFLEMNYRSFVSNRHTSFLEFSRNRLYMGFVRFGQFVVDQDVFNPHAFVDFLIKGLVPLDQWKTYSVYVIFLRELNKREGTDSAVSRTFSVMRDWAARTGNDWFDFFRLVDDAQATMWIRSGRVSPLVLYTAPSAVELIERLDSNRIIDAIDPDFWSELMRNDVEAVNVIREEMEIAGL